ncbi:MAG: hypothetical protein JXR96_00465 [Deltaproteobacteria bacterium]|nr:hypothetical protein [Deltaproteobacteria bacterium]
MLLCISVLGVYGCETQSECAADADCDDADSCTQDRCRLGRCAALRIPGCCHGDEDCGISFGPRCDTGSERCVECLVDADCDTGMTCELPAHTCFAPRAGAPCLGDGDCESGWCLNEIASGYPGGFCGRACQSTGDCESGACVDVPGGRTCLPICRGDHECRSEYLCMPVAADRGACFPHCTLDAQCPAAGHCNRWLGLCAADTPGGANGAPCADDADCKGFCAREADTGAPGGVCISICSPARLPCPEDHEACVWQLSPYLGSANVCLPVFDREEGCRPAFTPLVAVEFLPEGDPQAIGTCQPACRGPSDCASGICNTFSGLCDDPLTGSDHGAACTSHADCKGLCLSFWTGGYCIGPCHLDEPDCAVGSACIDLGIQASCLASCQSDTDCRQGYVCEPTARVCVPPA